MAFFIDDAHHGRGIATVLLEYLAVAARRAGISAFTATCCRRTAGWSAVFRQAGFEARSTFDDGVIEVHLDIAADARGRGRHRGPGPAGRGRGRCACCWRPASVAVIGAGRERDGRRPRGAPQPARRTTSTGPSTRSTRSADHVGGVRAVAAVGDIDGPGRPGRGRRPGRRGARRSSRTAARKRVKAVDRHLRRLRRVGARGRGAVGRRALRAARRFGIRLLGPNCLGVINTDPEVRLHATFATPDPRAGPVALLSESGTIGGALLDRVGEAGLGASSFAAIGNRADVSANDLLQYWADDDRTDVVLLYLESFGNARKFSRIAREVSRTKPIVAVQSGGAARPTPSDGDARRRDTLHALLDQTGLIRVDTLAQQLDVARVLACQPLPAGNRVALVGNGGGSLALAADACVDAGLTLADARRRGCAPRSATPAAARGPPAGEHGRPRVRGRRATTCAARLTALLADDGVDSVLVGLRAGAPPADRRPGRRRSPPPGRRRPTRRCWPACSGPIPTTITVGGHGGVPCSPSPTTPPTRWAGSPATPRWRAAARGRAGRARRHGRRSRRRRAWSTRWPGRRGDGPDVPTAVAAEVLRARRLPMVPSAVVGDAEAAAAGRRRARLPGGGQGGGAHPPGQDRGRRAGARRPRRGRAAAPPLDRMAGGARRPTPGPSWSSRWPTPASTWRSAWPTTRWSGPC